MTSATLQNIENEAALYGIIKQHGLNPHRRVEWKVTCRGKGCLSNPLLLHFAPNIPPEVMIKDVRKKGWLVDRHERPLCPLCTKAISRKARELDKPRAVAADVPKAALIPTGAVSMALCHLDAMTIPFVADTSAPFFTAHKEPSMNDMSTPVPKAQNFKIQRQIFALLDQYLDEVARCYRNGYSDQRIADEVGCSLKIVQEIRFSICELIEDTRVSALRDDIAAFERALAKVTATATADIAALRSRLEQIALSTKSR